MTRDEMLEKLLLDVAEIKALLAARPVAVTTTATTGAIADDYDLDSQYGDPVVKKDPKRWTGNSFVGSKFSECPPEYLEVLASLFDWMAGKDDEAGKTWTNKKGEAVPASTFKTKDAARARGWAARNRTRPKQEAKADDFAADDPGNLPF